MMRLAFFYEPRILQLWQVVTNRAESLRTCSEFCQLSFLSSSSSCHGFEGSLKCKEQTARLQMEAFLSLQLLQAVHIFHSSESPTSENWDQVKVLQVTQPQVLCQCFPVINSSHCTTCISTLPLYRHSFL